MACLAEANIAEKRREKLQKFQQFAFESRERLVSFMAEIVLLVIGCLGGGNGGTGRTDKEADKREISTAMGSMTVLMESETILRKIMSEVVQVE